MSQPKIVTPKPHWMWCDRCNHFVMPMEDWAGKHCPVRHFSTLTEERPKTSERVGCSNAAHERPANNPND